MNRINIEQSLSRAIHQAPMIDFDKLAKMPVTKVESTDPVLKQNSGRQFASFKNYSLAVACSLLLLIGVSGWYVENRLPESIVTLDVNPSIVIVTNRQARVLSVEALNEDGRSIIGDQNYKDTALDKAIENLLDEMVDQNYIDANRNVVMVSVENKDMSQAEALSIEIGNEIRAQMLSKDIKLRILRQYFTRDRNEKALSEELHVTVGKLRLVRAIGSAAQEYSIETLSKMSIVELMEISKSSQVDLGNVITEDEPAIFNDTDSSSPSNTVDDQEDHENSNDSSYDDIDTTRTADPQHQDDSSNDADEHQKSDSTSTIERNHPDSGEPAEVPDQTDIEDSTGEQGEVDSNDTSTDQDNQDVEEPDSTVEPNDASQEPDEPGDEEMSPDSNEVQEGSTSDVAEPEQTEDDESSTGDDPPSPSGD